MQNTNIHKNQQQNRFEKNVRHVMYYAKYQSDLA